MSEPELIQTALEGLVALVWLQAAILGAVVGYIAWDATRSRGC